LSAHRIVEVRSGKSDQNSQDKKSGDFHSHHPKFKTFLLTGKTVKLFLSFFHFFCQDNEHNSERKRIRKIDYQLVLVFFCKPWPLNHNSK
jgi:hypothetical protein